MMIDEDGATRTRGHDQRPGFEARATMCNNDHNPSKKDLTWLVHSAGSQRLHLKDRGKSLLNTQCKEYHK